MECPHCGYEETYNDNDGNTVIGEEGKFFYLSNNIIMERPTGYYEPETRMLYGCPNCNKLFMDY